MDQARGVTAVAVFYSPAHDRWVVRTWVESLRNGDFFEPEGAPEPTDAEMRARYGAGVRIYRGPKVV